ncbi:MAG: hypothetical protein KGV50_07740 [Gammaproteobacteria bacterium]|nr:hypothetical protein [Gammaproteobacteria bacterium]
MKIPVYEIEGNQYCKIDDITIAKSKAAGTPRTKERCLADLIQGYDVFFVIRDMHHVIYSLQANILLSPKASPRLLGVGIYHIIGWRYPCEDQYQCCYEDHPYTCVPTQIQGFCEGHTTPSPRNKRPAIKINEIGIFDHFKIASKLCDPETGEQKEYGIAASDCFIGFTDAKIYLADCGITDNDFLLPTALDNEKQTEVRAKEIDSTLPCIDIDNPSYPPYLNIAIEMWERYFIDGEKVSGGKATNSDKVNIERLLDKYYPALSSNAKKTIAEVAVTKKGENKDNFKKNNN